MGGRGLHILWVESFQYGQRWSLADPRCMKSAVLDENQADKKESSASASVEEARGSVRVRRAVILQQRRKRVHRTGVRKRLALI